MPTARRPMPAPNTQVRYERLNRWLLPGLAVALAAWLASVAGANPWLWIFAPVYWLLVVAMVLLVQWAWLRIRRAGAPKIPGVPARLQGSRALLLGLVGFVVVATLVREGAFDPFVLNYDAWTATHRMSTNTQSGSNRTEFDGAPPIRLLGLYTECFVNCSERSAVCEAIADTLRCDNHRGAEPVGPVAVIQGFISPGQAPACYTPWHKEATVSFSANLTISANHQGASAHHTITLSGTLDQSMTGIASCYSFQKTAGAQIGQEIAAQLRRYIAAN